ncbi:uncharacterized protein BDV17DRAFT_293163 [Aspergillus undulatus]|uniref:uncharacterized protein n=1 Tax=Aspergillus undulatus TaxID=1810928 RepID=UPI003CCE1786
MWLISCILLFSIFTFLSSAAEQVPGRSWSVLEIDNIQTASQHDGLPSNNSIGYVPSATDAANFINYCSKRVLTNGNSFKQGSCNGIVMGDIPSERNMISTIITFPFPGQILPANTPFHVKFRTSNLNPGSVTNPNTTLYSAPQSLRDGNIVGHIHVTIQSLLSASSCNNVTDRGAILPPDPAKFVFFKTVFDTRDVRGLFSVNVTEGLPIGFYRACTMVAAINDRSSSEARKTIVRSSASPTKT